MKRLLDRGLGVGFVLLLAANVGAQEAKSSALVKQLAAALDAAKLDSIGAKDPAQPDVYVAALYFPGVQILAVSGKYSAPALLNDKLGQKDYRNVYLDLFGASIPGTKVFVEDLGANGLQPKRTEGQPFDAYEAAGKRTAFDGDWKNQKLSEEEYVKLFSMADEQYSHMVTALLAALRRTP